MMDRSIDGAGLFRIVIREPEGHVIFEQPAVTEPGDVVDWTVSAGKDQGSIRSITVASLYIEQDARLKIGTSPADATQNMLPGSAGAP
ncbi:MAG: hypothetical protein R2849_20670 [Thermomicrobiales bacterium]